MKAVEVKGYECPVCHRHYETKEEAEACNSGYEPKKGDLLLDDCNKCYEVFLVEHDWLWVTFAPDWYKAKAWPLPSKEKMVFPGREFLCCGTKLLPVDEVEHMSLDLEKRLASAKKLLEIVKAQEVPHED